MSNYIESNNLGRKSGPVSGIERIRYSGCFITLKIEGENSGPTKSAGFMGIPVLRGSGIEGFYCTMVISIAEMKFSTWIGKKAHSRPVLHHCVVIFVWSSGIMDCMLLTF